MLPRNLEMQACFSVLALLTADKACARQDPHCLVQGDGAGDLAVVVGELDREVHVELGELSNAGLAVELLGVCMCVYV
jgi:hypothetical protein